MVSSAAVVALHRHKPARARAARRTRVTVGTVPTLSRGVARLRVIVDLALPPLSDARRPRLLVSVARSKLDFGLVADARVSASPRREQSRAAAQIRARSRRPASAAASRCARRIDRVATRCEAAGTPAPVVGEEGLSERRVHTRARPVAVRDRRRRPAAHDRRRRHGIKIAMSTTGSTRRKPVLQSHWLLVSRRFPRGITTATTPKVIVARVFPGPNSGKPGRLAVDPRRRFTETHVAGIAAGVAGTTAPQAPTIRP